MSVVRRVVTPVLAALLVAFSVGVVPVPALAVTEWSLKPTNGHLAMAGHGRYPVETITDLTVLGVQQDDGTLELTINGPADADGWIESWVMLVMPLSSFARPRQAATDDPPKPWLVVSGGQYSCVGTGNVDVHDVGFDSAGRVSRLWFTYQHACDGGFGEVRWGVPTSGPRIMPASGRWHGTLVGGSGEPMMFLLDPTYTGWNYSARISGPDASQFAIPIDVWCSPLCRTSVDFRPTSAGLKRAWLEVPRSTGTLRVPLEGRALPGKVALRIDGDEGQATAGGVHETLTPESGRFTASAGTASFTQYDFVEASVKGYDGISYDVRFHTAGTRLTPGTTYSDTNEHGGVIVDVSRYVGSFGRSCGGNGPVGTFTVLQLVRTPGQDPAFDVEFDTWCDYAPDLHLRGRLSFGVRADVTDPAKAANVRMTSTGALAWSVGSDVVRSVVRVRKGGLGSVAVTGGTQLYAGSGTSVSIPSTLVGKSVSYDVFTLDAAGNVASASRLVTRGATSVSVARSSGTLVGRVTDKGWAYRLASRTVILQSRAPGGTWSEVKRSTTGQVGTYRFTISVATTREFRVVAAGTTTHLTGTSAVIKVTA